MTVTLRLPLLQRKDQVLIKKVVDFWQKNWYFQQQPCNFKLEKVNMPEMIIFYVNQASQSYKNDKKVYYCNYFIIG